MAINLRKLGAYNKNQSRMYHTSGGNICDRIGLEGEAFLRLETPKKRKVKKVSLPTLSFMREVK